MGKKKKKSFQPSQPKEKSNKLTIFIPLKKLLGRIPVPKIGHFHSPKKGKGASYNRKMEKRVWKKEL